MRVFSSNRGRPAKTGKPARKGARVQLNARVPEQLALQFNEAASRGQRDNLVIDALQRFLAQREEPVRPRAKTALARDVSAIDRVSNDREALELIRYHAAAILQIADKATGLRKGPKAVRRVRRSTRGRRA